MKSEFQIYCTLSNCFPVSGCNGRLTLEHSRLISAVWYLERNKNDCLETSVNRYSSSPTIFCPDAQFCGHNLTLAESTAVSILDDKECYLFAQSTFSCKESVEQLEKAGWFEVFSIVLESFL